MNLFARLSMFLCPPASFVDIPLQLRMKLLFHFSQLFCRGFNTEIAMKRAMKHVEENYAVVGILEEMNKTLTVLEHYVPRFFKGALNTYWESQGIYSKINRNIYKPPVSEATKEIVRKNFTREIEFFEFCKQRLHKQYMALNLNGLEAQP